MKKIFSLFGFLFLSSLLFANGVSIGNAITGACLKLNSSAVSVNVENQVAIVKANQIFTNAFNADTVVKFGFPLTDKQSPTKLRWKIYGKWNEAIFTAVPQDTSLPGGSGEVNANLKTYLGNTPLFFSIPDRIMKDSTLEIELTYVEFLPYSFGNVDFVFRNDYRLIQSSSLNIQSLSFKLNSQRHIDSLNLLSHQGTVNNYGDSAAISFQNSEQTASADYKVRYSLSLTQLGLFGMSTSLNDSASVADSVNGGYFMFVAEPAPSSNVINKVFTLIIDRSGSMSGEKIEQAKNAAKYIVNNLNEGDKFNIIDFDDVITSFRSAHVGYNIETKNAALTYISELYARNMTDIAGAFSVAIPQFAASDPSNANIIIFFTDGQPTAGLIDIEQILSHVHNLVVNTGKLINLFTFGIGDDANGQLLSLLATQNNGLSAFLANSELESKITEFYMKIRNPVLTNTVLSFTPSNVVSQCYPNPLPNLYKGQQLLVSGRYNEPANITVHLSGKAFGQDVTYDYPLNLTNQNLAQNQFLTKVWAKSKIENLTIQYYSFNPNSAEAAALKNEITRLSLRYGVISIFTSFSAYVTDVQLATFSGTRTADGVFLEWRTGNENLGNGFYVERKYDNNDWETVGFVKSYGNSSVSASYSYKDALDGIKVNGYVSYRLKQTSSDGSVNYSKTIEVMVNTLPNNYLLGQNYPNPFNPSTKIIYSIPERGFVSLKLYDVLGNEIRVLVNEFMSAGQYEVTFSAEGLSSGVYFYRMEAGTFRDHKKLLILK